MSLTKVINFLKGNLGIMTFSSGIWTIAGQLVWPFQSIYILSLGGSYFHIGLISSIGAFSSLLPTLYGGILADSMGRKKIITSMSFVLSINSLLYAFARDWRWIVAASVFNALASGLRQPAFNSIIADSTEESSRAQSYAVWSVVPPIFGLASPYFMGVYMDRYGVKEMIRLGYIALGATSFIASLIRHLYLEETLDLSNNDTGVTRLGVVDGLYDTVNNLSHPLMILGFMGLFFGFGAAVGGPFWITYATKDIIKLSMSQWGLITAANTFIGVVVGLPLSRVADRQGRLKLLYPSIILTPFAIIGFIHCTNFIQTFVISMVITVLGSMGMSSGQALFTDLTDPSHRGRINSLWSVAGTMQSFSVGSSPGSLMGAAGNLFGGYLYENMSKSLPLYIQSAMVGVTAVTGVLFLSEPDKTARVESMGDMSSPEN
jgi:MFS family permease